MFALLKLSVRSGFGTENKKESYCMDFCSEQGGLTQLDQE